MPNKSEAIRQAFAELGENAKARQVREHLLEKRIKVKDQLIYGVKRRMNGPKKNGLSMEQLLMAKKLVDDCGGIDQAREVLATYEKLV